MKTRDIMSSLQKHWEAARAGDLEAQHEIYSEDATLDFPQSGETVTGRDNIKAMTAARPDKPTGYEFLRILGSGNLWVSECIVTYEGGPEYTVTVMEFRKDKVFRETCYSAPPLEAPAWRAGWVTAPE